MAFRLVKTGNQLASLCHPDLKGRLVAIMIRISHPDCLAQLNFFVSARFEFFKSLQNNVSFKIQLCVIVQVLQFDSANIVMIGRIDSLT